MVIINKLNTMYIIIMIKHYTFAFSHDDVVFTMADEILPCFERSK